MSAIEAVLFDFGGVFTISPFAAVRAAGEAIGIGGDVAMHLCFGPYDEDTDHAWHRLERGELALGDARTELVALALEAGHEIDPFTLFAGMGAAVDDQKEAMVVRARAVRTRGVRMAVVTNNVKEFGEGWRKLLPLDELFDEIIDSSAIGIRKPDPRIYGIALEALGKVPAERAVLLDDAVANIEAARALGIHGIVVGEDRLAAMDELDALLDG